MATAKKVLVAPLDWGLGHATRCIPVIRELLAEGFEVMIASEGQTSDLLQQEFPQLSFISLKGYRLSYSAVLPAWLKIFLQLPKIFSRMVAEHHDLKKIISIHGIDAVISDNRFGLWNKKICSVYITHQLMIKTPSWLHWLEPFLYAMHKRIVKQYDFCWIPDFEGEQNLSGDLAHKYPLPSNAVFINPLSRFRCSSPNHFEYDLCAILSGPEPSRSDFEKKILAELVGYTGKIIVVLGNPGGNEDRTSGNTRIVSHLPSEQLEKTIHSSKHIICRSGYSGIMDLVALGKTALLIPTPGQTEQEYLAAYLSGKKFFAMANQASFNLKDALINHESEIFNAEFSGSRPLNQAIEKLRGCV